MVARERAARNACSPEVAGMSRVGPSGEFEPIEIERGTRVFVLTGAGISAESGVATFRDAGGLWYQHRVEDVATPEGFARDPRLVWRFYSERRKQVGLVKPNPAHVALAEVERFLGDDLFLVTQNVDPLHELSGSKRVLHMHGELLTSRCDTCPRPPFRDERTYFDEPPVCDECGGTIRPDVIWFGEIPLGMREIAEAVEGCDLFLTVGSSGSVYPAAGLVAEARARSRPPRTVYVGVERPDNASLFDECRLGPAGLVLPGLFKFSR
jgi:NAD-dependent deacetylase